ncbi:MAG TPA: non-canonical purine NTP pyrophosphatase, partial [Gaiellaceae bacterium]|nr:non-canonical purine NTP pyrophosphatase [Gaiellaceae bacterium]
MRVRLCSRNEHKRRELQRLLPDWTIELLDADDYPPEDGSTYYENALTKARFGRRIGPGDAWMLGEDSGIEVAGLDGLPGVHSSRSAAG